jgi:hypothetical protein
MKSKILQWLAIILILEVGLVHYFSSQHEFEEAAILGYLFMANFLGALVAAYGIYRQKIWGWGLGFAIAAGSIAGYIWSRTAGLPGLEVEPWLDPWGLVSLVSESLFILLFLLRPWKTSPNVIERSSLPIWQRYLLPSAALICLILVNYSTYQLETVFSVDGHAHELSLEAVKRSPVLSLEEFEEQYGMQVSLVGLSAMDSIVDVRVKVVDSEKADQLLEEHNNALLVGDTLILSPNMHRHTLKQGKPYIVFYPNPQNIVKGGTPVSLVFDDFRLEPITAK